MLAGPATAPQSHDYAADVGRANMHQDDTQKRRKACFASTVETAEEGLSPALCYPGVLAGTTAAGHASWTREKERIRIEIIIKSAARPVLLQPSRRQK